MTFLRIKTVGLMATAAFFVACASKPTHVVHLSPNANPTAEIQKTSQMLADARQEQIHVLSPEMFKKSEDSLKEAISRKDNKRTDSEVLERVAESRAWLMDAKSTATIAETKMKDITDAREGALRADAPRYFKAEWDKANDSLTRITHSIEKGNLKPSDRKGTELVATFKDLETRSISKKHLGVAQDNLDKAVRAKAEKNAPKTYQRAVAKFDAAQKFIAKNPKSLSEIQAISRDATRESERLLDIMEKVAAGNSEELILQTMKQEQQISHLRSEQSHIESALVAAKKKTQTVQSELAKKEALEKHLQYLRTKLEPDEAEVFAQNGKIVIRLKGVQFASASTRLNPNSQALLSRVDAAISGISASKITVEGHTDNIGRADSNLVLSEARAKSVENYLSDRGTLERISMEAIGRGAESPISDNSTPSGRAQNRRIDLVIETL